MRDYGTNFLIFVSQNYTELGFKKIKTPPALFSLIAEFFERNRDKGKLEQWGIGNTYTNNWESQSEMISVEDSSLRGGGYQLKQKIWNSARNVISEWTGEELTQCSLYGIRVYKEGAVLGTFQWTRGVCGCDNISLADFSDSCGSTAVGIERNYQCCPGRRRAVAFGGDRA